LDSSYSFPFRHSLDWAKVASILGVLDRVVPNQVGNAL
jgi:hypothetical protein